MPSIQVTSPDLVMGDNGLPKIQGDLLILLSRVCQDITFSERKYQAFLCDIPTELYSKGKGHGAVMSSEHATLPQLPGIHQPGIS